MRRPRRFRLAAVRPASAVPAVLTVLVALVALVAAGCSGTSGAPTASPTGVQVISVSYAGGVITPPEGRVPVKLGSHVELRVTSDVAETVHNHLNGAEQDVAAGATVVFDFIADKPGIYEVELHKADKLLLELAVQ